MDKRFSNYSYQTIININDIIKILMNVHIPTIILKCAYVLKHLYFWSTKVLVQTKSKFLTDIFRIKFKYRSIFLLEKIISKTKVKIKTHYYIHPLLLSKSKYIFQNKYVLEIILFYFILKIIKIIFHTFTIAYESIFKYKIKLPTFMFINLRIVNILFSFQNIIKKTCLLDCMYTFDL